MLMAIPETKPNNVMLDAAFTYAKYGWQIFPCRPQDKRPITENGFKDATTDLAQIELWWKVNPNAMMGVACGASGIYVLDYDAEHDPDKLGAKRIEELTQGAPTRKARTGGGGYHLYYQMPKGALLPNTAGRIGPGVDTRGDGGYVIAPPSEGGKGAYTWMNQAPLAPLPPKLLEALQTQPEQPKGNGAVSDPIKIPEGMRDDTLYRDACAMRRRGMSLPSIERALLADNQERYEPPLPEDQVRAKVQSALKHKPEDRLIGETGAVLIGRDSVQVTILGSEGNAAVFSYDQMERTSRDLNAVLTVEVAGQTDRVRRRINMLSGSAQKDVRLELDTIYGKGFGWARALNRAFGLAEDVFLKQKRSIALPDIPPSIRSLDVIETLLPSNGITMLYGLGGSNKSYLALACAVASATGQPFAGQYEALRGNVLYIDYEDKEEVFRDRASRLLNGSPLPPGIHYYSAGGVPLKDQWEAVKTVCDEELIHWLIVDSVGPAVAGDMKDAGGPLSLTNTLNRLNLPGLLIHHLSKEGDGSSAYGSVYFGNAVRRAWFAEALDTGSPDDIQIQLRCTKVNEGRKPAPVHLRVTFEGDREGAVRILSRQPTLAEQSPHGKLRAALSNGAKTIQQLVTELGEPDFSVRRLLIANPEEFVSTTEPSPTRGRPRQMWGLKWKDPNAKPLPEVPF